MKKSDLKGQRFGFLLVLEFVGVDKNHHSIWRCKCDCGNEAEVRGLHLTRGQIACGSDYPLKPKPPKKHGAIGTTEYRSWDAMKKRVQQKRKGYENIKLSPRWVGENGFTNFLADMGPKPTPKHTIDRFPNRDGNYEPGNCRWATTLEQNKNRRPTSEWREGRKENYRRASTESWKKRRAEKLSTLLDDL